MPEYLVEVLDEGPITTAVSLDTAIDVIVEFANTVTEGSPAEPEVIEIPAYPPLPVLTRELLVFTHQGPLVVKTGTAQVPIHGGTFSIDSVSARVGSAPTGSNVVVDIKKNGVSIYSTPANRPTIIAGTNQAVVGTHDSVSLTDGDYLTVDIVSIGSTVPGSDLVVSNGLNRVA